MTWHWSARACALGLLAAGGLVACSGASSSSRFEPAVASSGFAVASPVTGDGSVQPARSYPLATLSHQTLGPLAARGRERTLIAWFAPPEGDRPGQDLNAILLAEDAAPLGPIRTVAHVVKPPELFVVQPSSTAGRGWVLAWNTALDRGEALTVLGIAPDGSPQGDPTDVHRTNDPIIWIDVLPTKRGSLCLWTEQVASGSAAIILVALDIQGKPRGVPMPLARGVQKWQAASNGKEIGVAIVSTAPRRGREDPVSSLLSWQVIDEDGQPKKSPTLVADHVNVVGDVEAVSVSGRWLLGWTDHSREESRVMLATLDDEGHLRGPTPAVAESGPSKLTALSANGKTAAVAWTGTRFEGETRALALGFLSSEEETLNVQHAAALEVGSSARPELVATSDGFALLAPARACLSQTESQPCMGPLTPTLIRLGRDLHPTQAEPLLVGNSKHPAAIGWAPSCDASGRCSALAGSNENPTQVFSVDLPVRSSPFAMPTVVPHPPGAAHVARVWTLSTEKGLQDLAAARIGSSMLLATLHTEGAARARGQSGLPSRRSASGSVIVSALVPGEQGNPSQRIRVATQTSTAGVSIAAAADPTDGALLAWISRLGTSAEVRLAQIAASGQLLRSLRLAPVNGDSSCVSVAWAGDGWLVAWVGLPGGQVYVSKVGRHLQSLARNQRITRAAVGAADVAIAVQGDTAWIAWSDARESPKEGTADIYAATVHAADASPLGTDSRVLATAGHSHSPSLAAITGSRAVVAWIEDVPGIEGSGAAMATSLDEGARLVSEPVALRLAGPGQATSIALTASTDEADAVVLRSEIQNGMMLDGLRLDLHAGEIVAPWPLIEVNASAAVNVPLALSGTSVIFADLAQERGERQIREAELVWKN